MFLGKVPKLIVALTIFVVVISISSSVTDYIIKMQINDIQEEEVKVQEKIEMQIYELDNKKELNDKVDILIDNKTEPVFSLNTLSKENIEKVSGVSWKPEAPVKLENLRLLEITYWGFDGEEHVGELIVHKIIADEVVEIFKELYEAKFPIEKIRLIDEYNANDNLSMEDNNTSAMCFRVVEGTDKLSKHSYGIAIDINPVQNPYVRGNKVSPEKGKEYLNRENVRKGMIVKNDICYKAFKSRGWIWGGDWRTIKDYQHFQKNIKTKELE